MDNSLIETIINKTKIDSKLLDQFQEYSVFKNTAPVTGYQISAYVMLYTLLTNCFFIEKNLNKSKNTLFNAARSMQIKAHFSKGGAGSQILRSIIHLSAPLISDCVPIIKDIPNWKSKFHEENIKSGSTYYVIQKLLSGNTQGAIEIWNNDKGFIRKKERFFMIERECVHKMILKDEKGLSECIYRLLEIGQDVYKKSRDKEPYLIDVRALSYIKLAYHLGMDISIEHELIPQDLVPFKPLENYQLLYDFMKRDDLPDFN
jgi:hypothetical protein